MNGLGAPQAAAPVRHVYVHVPFCARRCSYCDFAIAVRRDVPIAAFIDGVRSEIAARLPEPPASPVDTLYLGGGTPSRLGPDGVRAVLEVVTANWPVGEGAEVTIEANPEDVSRAVVEDWRRAGITRVSLGVQSFDERVLAWMHRTHDVERVHEAARALREAGIEDWSLDLIYALPAEVPRDWRRDLVHAAALAPPHVSVYGLTFEPQTPAMRWRERGLVREADEGRYEEEFLTADEFLTGAGLEHYEVSNYAREGRRARHNSAYWTRVPYVGLGPSAHGFDGATRRWNAREYAAWLRLAQGGRDPVAGEELLTPEQAGMERVYLGLRSSIGVQIASEERAEVTRWVTHGWATLSGGRVRLTPSGWLRLDALAAALTDIRSR